MKTLIILIAVAFISGCTIFSKPVTKVVVKAVDKYCQEPYSARLAYYETINTRLALHGQHIVVICAGDPEHDDSVTP